MITRRDIIKGLPLATFVSLLPYDHEVNPEQAEDLVAKINELIAKPCEHAGKFTDEPMPFHTRPAFHAYAVKHGYTSITDMVTKLMATPMGSHRISTAGEARGVAAAIERYAMDIIHAKYPHPDTTERFTKRKFDMKAGKRVGEPRRYCYHCERNTPTTENGNCYTCVQTYRIRPMAEVKLGTHMGKPGPHFRVLIQSRYNTMIHSDVLREGTDGIAWECFRCRNRKADMRAALARMRGLVELNSKEM